MGPYRDRWKGDRPWLRLKERTGAGEEPEDHKRFGSHTFVPISWMCKKQTAVSHSSTESEIISLDTGLRLVDAESVRSGNSHVTSQPMLFPKHPIPEGLLRPSFVSPAPQRRAARHLGYTWKIGKRFCKSTDFLYSSLSSRVESMEENH